jgi:hypothetical protein
MYLQILYDAFLLMLTITNMVMMQSFVVMPNKFNAFETCASRYTEMDHKML